MVPTFEYFPLLKGATDNLKNRRGHLSLLSHLPFSNSIYFFLPKQLRNIYKHSHTLPPPTFTKHHNDSVDLPILWNGKRDRRRVDVLQRLWQALLSAIAMDVFVLFSDFFLLYWRGG
jgi:hypothetical protein